MSFPRALAFIREVEGGYSDHPQDPGGATFAGVSLRAVVGLDLNGDGILDFDLDGDGDVDADDIKALEDHPERVEAFYRERYWDPIRGDELPFPLALATFDAAVNHGVRPGTLLLQRALGLNRSADGIVGPETIQLALDAPPRSTLRNYFIARKDLYVAICRKRGWVFASGWWARTLDLQAAVL